MKPFYVVGIFLLSIGLSATVKAANDSIVKIERQGRAPVLYLATIPETATKVGAILFAGSNGVLDLAGKGIPQPGSNFLIRSRNLFSEHGVATASFDPSADSGPLSDNVRMSALHAEEVELVMTDFKKRYGLDEIYLVGTSRGTISAAHLGAYFKDRISGVVLTSTVFSSNRVGPGLAGFNFDRIQAPLLFVHHRRDACKVTPPSGAESMSGRFTVAFVDGGAGKEGGGCGPFSAHGYLGREKETVDTISNWIFSRKPGISETKSKKEQ
ncbi:MAG TPA: alpha/beta fold hydrolase [Noviherbaspirillum sp.]